MEISFHTVLHWKKEKARTVQVLYVRILLCVKKRKEEKKRKSHLKNEQTNRFISAWQRW